MQLLGTRGWRVWARSAWGRKDSVSVMKSLARTGTRRVSGSGLERGCLKEHWWGWLDAGAR